MTDNTQSDVVEAAKAMAGHFGPVFEVLAKDRRDFREWQRETCDYVTTHTQADLIEAAHAVLTALRSDRDAVVEEERAAIVAWLEATADERGKKTQDGWALHWAADRIAADEHHALKDTPHA